MQLLEANPAPQGVGLEELPGKANYFRGHDPQQWRTNVPTYAKVKYAAVYPGVDLVYYGQARQLEYDFVVAPGADPAVITLGFEGVDRVDVDAQGDLVLSTASGSLRFQKPVIYQEADGRRHAIAGSYVRKGPHQVGFQLAAYDVTRPLVIDPVLSYATYLGGSSFDEGAGIAVDATGAAYVTGRTGSSNFPTAHPLQPMLSGFSDAFVAKLSADGTNLVYATYLGGSITNGGRGIAVDTTGHAYVTGFTTSPDFPTTPGAFQVTYGGADCAVGGCGDAFVAKLSADGAALVYATYLGGSSTDEGNGIAVDITGAAYVTGFTFSPDFPTVHPIQPAYGDGGDAFVAKLNAAGSALVYATYLGGSGFDHSGGTFGDATGSGGIAVDATGAAYVTGQTGSADFPTVHPLQPTFGGGSDACIVEGTPCGDAFVAKLNAAGSTLVYATYLGGSSDDGGAGIAVDATGAAYITGFTTSPDFPTQHPVQSAYGGFGDAFVAKLNAAGSALVYATYLGGSSGDGGAGSGGDKGTGIAVDATGAAYVTGVTRSPDFPTVHPLQPTLGGGCHSAPFGIVCDEDAFVAKLRTLAFAGTPGTPNCQGQSVSALAQQFGGLEAAAAALGFPSVQALQDAIREFCEE
jgi:hypothetical protein